MMEQKTTEPVLGVAGCGRKVLCMALAILFAQVVCAAEIAFTGAGARSSLSF